MIIEVSLICLTVLVVACMIFTHFERNRVKPSVIDPKDIENLWAAMEAHSAELKKVEAKFTKASISQVFR